MNSMNIIGSISMPNNIVGNIESNLSLNGNIEIDSLEVNLDTGHVGIYQDYSGSYDIVPTTENQTLQTKDKMLRQNLLVEKIPYYETSNEYGYTAYIGSEVEINGD